MAQSINTKAFSYDKPSIFTSIGMKPIISFDNSRPFSQGFHTAKAATPLRNPVAFEGRHLS